MSNKDVELKFVVVGDGAVGKTCLLQAFSDGNVNRDHVPTIFENSQKIFTHNNVKYNLDLWDTAGQENFDRLRPLSYKGVDCFLLCFDVSNNTSLDNIKYKWIKEVQAAIEANKKNEQHAKGQVMLVGTKSDMRGVKSETTTEVTDKQIAEHRTYVASQLGFGVDAGDKIKYVETSAWQDKNITKVFQTAIELCMDQTGATPTGSCCTIL